MYDEENMGLQVISSSHFHPLAVDKMDVMESSVGKARRECRWSGRRELGRGD